nr:uncharacterized protein LOC126056819 [Helicoverpa armigera]
MTRCDYDVVFYRVFCVTLLAIAFTFTLILTNVFIDIDGLLASKKDKHNIHMNDKIIRDEFTSEATDNNYEINYGENDDSYRTKRSTETQSFLFHIKNPKIKNVLANRLSTLLEELDAEESMNNNKPNKDKKIVIDAHRDAQVIVAPKVQVDEKKKKAEDLLHLTVHNILLQGIIGHMDLNDVYKKVYALMTNLHEVPDKKGGLRTRPEETERVGDETKLLPKPIEDRFIAEILNCNELKEQIERAGKTDEGVINKSIKVKGPPNMVIKTIIDITSDGNDPVKENDTKSSKENIKGIIEVIYNGKKMKFGRPDTDISTAPPIPLKRIPLTSKPKKPVKLKIRIPETTTAKYDINSIPKAHIDKFIEEYFKRFPRDNKETNDINEHETKRLKRHVKLKKKHEHKSKHKKEDQDDELYVEIETHFDSKGMQGEKKKKLIRNLIDKIQNAIHSNADSKPDTNKENPVKKRRKLHFKKRIQDPLKHANHDHVLVNKYSIPLDSIIHRQLHPISKTVPMQESSPAIGTNTGEEWRKPFFGPTFLTNTKSINSAEMSEVEVDYNRVLDINGVPQRLQLPLNVELSDETYDTKSYYDVGKMKFFIKDIDGSGFSVGFNQYVDQAPDSETMRLFTGLENVLKTYHQTYDPNNDPVTTTETILNPDFNEGQYGALSPNDEHIIERRSLKNKGDYHSNEYKVIYDHNFMPYDDYRDIFDNNIIKTEKSPYSPKNHYKELPLVVDENIFDKNLKPAEIFGLANLFERKKRSINVKKISNLNSKIKLSRYLNTKAMATKRIFLNKKRNKRQINKIRIIATDLPHISKHSDENVFVVSDENVFADRAIVKEVETSEAEHDKQDDDFVPVYQSEDTLPQTFVTKIFDGRSRHNPLMSKYPHIFMEEISRSREEYLPNNALLFGKIPGLSKISENLDTEKTDEKIEVVTTTTNDTDPNMIKEQDIVNALLEPSPKANYKVTVKIIPKNSTGLHSGFKEVHTSINKRFNKNGLLYSSLVNVSEISKITKLNRSKSDGSVDLDHKDHHETSMSKKIRDQQERMQFLLKQHAKHINEQLNRLKKEKSNLESLIESDNITEIKYIDYDESNAYPKKYIPPTKEDTTVTTPVVQTTVVTAKPKEHTTVTTLHTTVPTTTQHTTTPAKDLSDKVKRNLITSIERNGNLTDQILKKIDRNTEILQAFLKKLTEKIHVITPAPVTEHIIKPTTVTYKPVHKKNENIPHEWNHQGIPFHQNMMIRKNESHITIPFVYALQQPILPQHKTSIPMANVVYHGHIHTNAGHIEQSQNLVHTEKDKPKIVNKIESNNQSRFFIDELENDYKVIQVGDVKKNREYNMVNLNGTLA